MVIKSVIEILIYWASICIICSICRFKGTSAPAVVVLTAGVTILVLNALSLAVFCCKGRARTKVARVNSALLNAGVSIVLVAWASAFLYSYL